MLQDHTVSQNSFFNQSYIRIIPKNPYTVYAYWEISSDTSANFSGLFGLSMWENSDLAIKVYNISKNIHYFIKIASDINSCYININQPDNIIVFEIGKKISEEFFISFAASNLLHMPNDEVNLNDPIFFTNVKEFKQGKDISCVKAIYDRLDSKNTQEILGPSSTEHT